ncbi:hypothetical protein C0995_016231 [Termitomyces sp. Mi166|nr:hypothetical protein C0995_016231 [Termitomyces sp. Mi166\
MITAELNYDIYDKELLAIVKAFKQWQAYLEVLHYDKATHCLGAKPDALTRRSDIYLKKSFETDHNAFNKCIIIPPKHLNSVLLLNKEGLSNQIHSTSSNTYFKENDPQTATNNSVAALHDFTLFPDGKLLL